MGNAARKLDALRSETADPAVVVDLAEYKHRRSRSACRLASGSSLLGYESASEPGLYRYTAFGQTVEDTTTITQPLRWKGRWFSPIAGGIYDVRARQWSPEMGVFLAVDGFRHFRRGGTLWSWPGQSPHRWRDPRGHGPTFVQVLIGGGEELLGWGALFGAGVGFGIGGAALCLSGTICEPFLPGDPRPGAPPPPPGSGGGPGASVPSDPGAGAGSAGGVESRRWPGMWDPPDEPDRDICYQVCWKQYRDSCQSYDDYLACLEVCDKITPPGSPPN